MSTPQPVPRYVKDPDALLDYMWDWSADELPYLEDGETITDGAITVPTGITLDDENRDTTTVTAWLAGGTAGEDYRVVCHIVTSAGRTDERSILVEVRQR